MVVPTDPIKAEQHRSNLREAWKYRAPTSEKTKILLSEAGRKVRSTPEGKAKQKEILSRPETRKKMSESAKKRCTPEWKEWKSKQSKQQMSDPKLRERLSILARERYLNPEWKQMRRKLYDDPTFRKKLSAIRYRVKEQFIESLVGGFWYGSVKHYDTPQYCEKFNKEFKERVRAFWNYQCFECGTPQNGKGLCVHHVHYDKKMCCNGSPEDVIPLCPGCHNKTLFNRDYWEDYFTESIYAYSPDGKCFFTKEEMKSFLGGI